jgi:adenylate kinase family enzyme
MPNIWNKIEYLLIGILNSFRFIWIDAPFSICWDRLVSRRHDPNSARVVNLKKLPSNLSTKDVSSWIQAPEDQEEVVEARFKEYETAERDLRKVYGIRTPTNPTGIMHSIASSGVGEGQDGKNESVERVWELVEGHLWRPIPVTLQ